MTHTPPSAAAKLREFAWFWGHHGPWRRFLPDGPVPVPVAPRHHLAAAPPDAVRVTWIGHASTAVQIGGKTVLMDPNWSMALPGGIRRLTPPGVPWEGLPPIAAALVSHNHYDHLDLPTLRRLAGTPVLVPKGVGSWLERKGLRHVHELEWHESVRLGGLDYTLVPAHHWSRRGLRDHNRTLWGGWVVSDGRRKVYFAGDTGYGHHFRDIAQRHPGMDVAILPIGAYAPKHYNGGAHIDPAEAVRIFQELGARHMVPVHWGTFRLSPEPVEEPMVWLRTAWKEAGLPPERLWNLAVGETSGLDEPRVAAIPHLPEPQALPGHAPWPAMT